MSEFASDLIGDPYRLLADIEARARAGAHAGASQDDGGHYWSGVAFVLNGLTYVAPLTEVAEIMPLPALTKVPGARAWLRGVANLRGTLVPVADLQGFLGRRSSFSKRQRVLVINQDGHYVGVIVDDVLGLQHFDAQQQLDEGFAVEESVRPFVLGAFSREEQIWPVFSPHSLARHPSFRQVAL